MYNLKNVLSQSPEKVKTAVLSVVGVTLGILSSTGVIHIDPSLLETVGAGIAIERTLDLFYVAPTNRAKEDAALVRLSDALGNNEQAA